MEFNNNQLSQSVRNTISRLPQFETEVGQTVTRIDGDISARATKASDFVSAITSTNKGATQVELTALENSINQRISDLNYIQFVTELPETGEEKYIYAVVQDIYDRESHQIVVLYIWRDSEESGETGDWYLAGAFSINFDPNDYLLKTEAASTYLKLTGGTLTGNLILTNGKSLQDSVKGRLIVCEGNNTIIGTANSGNRIILRASSASSAGLYYQDTDGSGSQYKIQTSADKAVANGIASLDANTKVPVAQIPDLSGSYLPLSGGTLTGNLTLTNLNGNSQISVYGENAILNLSGSYPNNTWSTYLRTSPSDFRIYTYDSTSDNGFKIDKTTGELSALKNNVAYKLLDTSDKATANGVASLDANAQVPVAQLPIDTTLSQTSTNLLDNATITNALMQAADTISRGVYEKCDGSSSTSGSTITISLEDTKTIYKIKPLIDSTIVFDTTALSNPTNCWTTFYVIVDFSDGKVDLTWPSNVIWGNISPSGTANVRYMYSFMIPDDDNVIIGNEMQSWVRQ